MQMCVENDIEFTRLYFIPYLNHSFSYLNCTNCEMIVEETKPANRFLVPSQYRESSRSSYILYTADLYHYGDDRFGVVAEDSLGDYSLAYIFSIVVRFKPCLNNATCNVSTACV